MRLKRLFCPAAAAVFGAAFANAGSVSFTCDPSIEVATCNYLKTNVAGDYNNTFLNANASIYITYGMTGLASSTTGFYNSLTYATYVADLTANAMASGNPVQISAVAALNSVDKTEFGSTQPVSITSALGQALGVPLADLTGTTGPAAMDPNAACTLDTAGCYNGVVTLTNTNKATTWYYDNLGGSQAGLFDIYAAVEHEVDEVLGTSSCMSTQDASGKLTDPCDGALGGGPGDPSAVDLFRYDSQGHLALNSSYVGMANAQIGPYFSYDGGVTNGAGAKAYNTLANGDDYADFVATCPPTMAAPLAIQDATGCRGNEAGETIRNDGGGEINILNAIGYELPTPEPGTMALFGSGLAFLAGMAYRRRRT
jgi:hypothetical protein